MVASILIKEERMIRILLALLVLSSGSAAWSQSYPSKPVRIIVPFGVGGSADVYARYLGAKLQESVGQSFVVENRPGGGSIVGSDAVAKSDPDGYTLLMMSNTHTVDRKSTRLNSSHGYISYAVFCLKKKKKK